MNYNKKSVEDIDVNGKKVLVRCDFNVPLDGDVITDPKRIVEALPTIKYLLAHNAKVILCSHLGRPKGEFNMKYSLAPVAAKLSELCPDALPDYVKMIFLDTLVANPDRHTNNFGLLRDRQSGELLRLAPNFDNNMALISRGYPALPKKGDMLVELFNDFMSVHPEYKKFIPAVSEQTVRDCVRSLNMKVKTDYIVRFITERCALIEK